MASHGFSQEGFVKGVGSLLLAWLWARVPQTVMRRVGAGHQMGCGRDGVQDGAPCEEAVNGRVVVGVLLGVGLGLFVILSPWTVRAQQPDLTAGEREEASGTDEDVPVRGDVGLDQLLQLPDSGSYGANTRQGATAQTWRRRFADASKALTVARERIEKARVALDEMSQGGSTQWQMAPPGASASTEVAPMSLKQREEIRAGKNQLEEAERAQRSLAIEADLAGVPAGWRVPDGRED